MTTKVATNPSDRLLTPAELADRWSMRVGSLANMRSRQEGPPFLRIGRKAVRYRLREVLAFEERAAA